MASIRKRGNSYQITVSVGRDIYGKKLVETATFAPDPGMGKLEEKQALNQFVAYFEKRVKSGANIKAERMTLRDLSEIWFHHYWPERHIMITKRGLNCEYFQPWDISQSAISARKILMTIKK